MKQPKKRLGHIRHLQPLKRLYYSPWMRKNLSRITPLMNGLQYYEYEKVESSFSGEGSYTDALAHTATSSRIPNDQQLRHERPYAIHSTFGTRLTELD